jgi:putative membrane protein
MLTATEPDAVRRWFAMGGMMAGTGTGAWIVLWVLLGLALAVAAGVAVARVLSTRGDQPQVRSAESPAVREAKDALRRRYASGEISREEYLQAKVEIED